jgi:hypothetical protein
MQFFSVDPTMFFKKIGFFCPQKLGKPFSKVAQKNSNPLFFLTRKIVNRYQTVALKTYELNPCLIPQTTASLSEKMKALRLVLCQDFQKSFLLKLPIPPPIFFYFRLSCLTHTLHHRFQNWFWIWNPSNRNRNQLRKTVLLVTCLNKNTVVGWSRAKK